MSKRATKPAKPGKVVYVGPTITGVATRNAVYADLPESLSRAIQATPYLGGLCVPIPQLSGALEQLDRRQGGIYTLYTKALADSAEIQKGVIELGV